MKARRRASGLWSSVELMNRHPRVRVLACLGTRPEAIKLAPVALAAQREPGVDVQIVALGQHGRVCDDVLRFFGLPVALQVNVQRRGQSLASLSARCLTSLEPLFVSEAPDLILAQGDTTSAAMAGLAAFYAHIPLWHVEAGLRTSSVATPFPEEMNRRLITRLASFHFAPTERARANLLRENVAEDEILVSGNTAIDALMAALERRRAFVDRELESFVRRSTRLLVVTMHRRENWGEPIRRVCAAVRQLAERHPSLGVVHATHPNPDVRREARSALGEHPRILVSSPVDYGDFALLLRRAEIILTDSGGIQEEGPSLGVPVLVARDESERTEGIEAGFATLVGTETTRIITAVERILAGHSNRRPDVPNPYGDGRAAERIVRVIAAFHSARAGAARTLRSNTFLA